MSGSFHVPSFKEYLNICHNYQKSPIIEIKNDVPNTGFNWTDQHNDQYNYMILINAVINAGE
jgi:hypothetical protein